MKAEIIIMVGNIGSGKSTLCKEYAEAGYIVISMDSLRYMIGAGQYIYNKELEQAIWDSEKSIIRHFMGLKKNIIVDNTSMSDKTRKTYLWLAKQHKYRTVALVMPRLSEKECIDRRMTNPHGQPDRELWESVWTRFHFQYVEPTRKEGFDKVIKL